MNTFFITGFPRSRTAWLANFLTYGDSFCFHEATKYSNEIRDIKELFQSTSKLYVGNSDSYIPFFAQALHSLFPDAKWVFIERDMDDVARSLNRIFPGHDHQKLLSMSLPFLDFVKKEYSPLMVKYEDLESMEECQKIWDYCIPTNEFDTERWKMLTMLKTEIMFNKTFYNPNYVENLNLLLKVRDKI
jgi:hypothetical protein